jgi:hypothetical protein
MSYEEKAFEIIKESIKSAIFIDEKAKEFYSNNEVNVAIEEEKLSLELYQNFKSEGISLAIHKFIKSDIEDENVKRYLLKGRDLILLDWELDGTGGEEYSLKLLSEIINSPHINFCCIYTRTPRFDSIFSQIETYFSGLNIEDYSKIKDTYDFLDDFEILRKIHDFLFTNKETNIENITQQLGIDLKMHPEFIKNKLSPETHLLKLIYYTFLNNIKPSQVETGLNSIHSDSNSLIINNTIILILKKDDENDPKPSFLLKKIASELIRNKNSFIQLLGLEMQTVFNSNESFIDENILKSSTEALFKHRNYLKIKNKSDIPFSTLIKRVLIEHASLSLRTSKLSLLETDFLDAESQKYNDAPTQNDIASLNTFYNSVQIKSLNNRDFPNINFGDVFFDGSKSYYLCITALCDCLRPDKIKQNYYFVKGEEINIELANSLGDSAFISYFSENLSVSWVTYESSKPKKLNNTGLSEEQKQINNLKSENEALKQFQYKPVYVEPYNFNAKNPKITDNKIQVRRVESTKEVLDDNGTITFIDFYYISTLRPNYTQRIANHAFIHPVRVGVDFVKI